MPSPKRKSGTTPPDERYDQMLLLDRLEELREDMDELGVTSRDELDRRIGELHRQLGDA